MKTMKLVGRILLVIVVLLVVAAIALPLLFDPEAFKSRLTGLVREKTGRELVIGGDIDLSVFPWLAVEVEDVRLGNAPGFGDRPFAAVREVKVGVKLLPLLRKEVEVSSVKLEGLALHLARNRAGIANWADLAGEGAARGATEKGAAGAAGPSPAAAPLAALRVGGVQIEDATIDWDDARSGVRYGIEDLDLEIGQVEPDRPFDIRLHGRVTSTRPAMEGTVKLEGRMQIDAGLMQIEVAGLSLDTEFSGKDLPGERLDASLALAGRLDRGAGTLSVPRLSLAVLDLRFNGDIEGKGLNGGSPQFSGHVEADEFVPREVLTKLGIELPPTSDATVLGKADFEAGFSATPTSLALDPLKLRFDDTVVEGNLRVPAFEGPTVRYRLAVDAIDVDRYLPPRQEEAGKAGGKDEETKATGDGKAAPPATPGQAAAGAANALPLEPLRRLDLDGTLTIGELKAFGLRSRNVTLTTKASKGRLRLHPATAELYEGRYAGDIRLDVRGREPVFAMDEQVTGIQAGPLLEDLTGKAAMTGRGDVKVKLSGRGVDPERIKPTLDGNLSIAFRDGAIAGINIPRMIREARARIRGETLPPSDEPNQTDFASLTATAVVKEGVLLNNDLSLQSPLLRVAGKGKVDLPRDWIDYLLTVKLVGTLEGAGGRSMEELKGVPIPVRIKGPLQSPGFNVELDKVLKKAVEKKVKKKVEEKLKKKLGDKLPGPLGDQLKGIFGR